MKALSSKHKLLLYGSYIEKVFVFLTFKYLNSCHFSFLNWVCEILAVYVFSICYIKFGIRCCSYLFCLMLFCSYFNVVTYTYLWHDLWLLCLERSPAPGYGLIRSSDYHVTVAFPLIYNFRGWIAILWLRGVVVRGTSLAIKRLRTLPPPASVPDSDLGQIVHSHTYTHISASEVTKISRYRTLINLI